MIFYGNTPRNIKKYEKYDGPSTGTTEVHFCVFHYDNTHFSCTDAIESGSKHEHYKNPFSVLRSTYKRVSTKLVDATATFVDSLSIP